MKSFHYCTSYCNSHQLTLSYSLSCNVKLISDKICVWFNLSLPPVHCEQAHFDRKCFSCSCQKLPCHVQVAWPDLDCDLMPLTPLIFYEQHVNIHSCAFVYIVSHFFNAFHDLRTKIPHKHLSLLLSCESRPIDQCFPTYFFLVCCTATSVKVNYFFYWCQARNLLL